MNNSLIRVLAIIFLSTCLFGFRGKQVNQKEFGEKWPFTVSSGKIECRGYSEVVFVSGNKVYAPNGNADASKKYRDLFEVWKKDPKIPGTRVSIGDMISIGLKLCS